ncbi:MAG: queuosine precursor transporter [Clostridia bacterium]|nr:queuosine precursor transporter [Clostridia bacterium]
MPFQNELLLIGSLIFHFSAVLAAWRLFGKSGLYAMTVFSTVAANIEVMILVSAFGMEQTLGNVLFAASFLITDILSENEGKKAADRAVNLGIFTSLLFVLTTQSWLLFIPAEGDTVMNGMRQVFANTPRTILSSMLVYTVTQRFDVWLYHKWWEFTEKKYGDGKRFLWLRNNGSTLASQLLNTVLFTLCAFAGSYDTGTLFSIMGSSYLIFIITSLCDTPVVYIARWMKKKYQL